MSEGQEVWVGTVVAVKMKRVALEKIVGARSKAKIESGVVADGDVGEEVLLKTGDSEGTLRE